MEAADRPHRSNIINSTTTSELFICFTSRLSSSSSMRISSKSILSPGRAREPTPISLSNSLSRRLRSNGSMKGGQASPMFPTTNAKKRGGSFENPEPTSPKVTCIGQVRVKTKKQSNKLRTRSKSRGEASFRRIEQNSSNKNVEASRNSDHNQSLANHHFLNQQQPQECLPHRNQRWVHLPMTICEAVRAFGAEFNCFLPCRSSCMASEKEKEEKATTHSENGNSCGTVFARWLVAVQEGDGKGRQIELVVGEDEQREESSTERGRRHVFEEIEFKDENLDGGNGSLQEEEPRISICVPPKNALLLMRCRSDPVKMAALANKFWEAPVPPVEDDEEIEDGGNENEHEKSKVEQEMEHKQEVMACEMSCSCEKTEENQEAEERLDLLEPEIGNRKILEKSSDIELQLVYSSSVNQEQDMNPPLIAEENSLRDSLVEGILDPEHLQILENEEKIIQVLEGGDSQEQKPQGEEPAEESSALLVELKQELQEEIGQSIQDQEQNPPETVVLEARELPVSTADKATNAEMIEGELTEMTSQERSETEDPVCQGGQTSNKSKERETQQLLPDCLLLMMCEPKLSMEVSKETWVCTTDFIRWLPEHSRPSINKKSGYDDATKKNITVDANPQPPVNSTLQQPARSSCSYPSKPPRRVAGTETMTTVTGQKLMDGRAYEPLMLTRCKSEPMRSAAKHAQESCFWKNRKMEPHRAATLGVGAAGVV